LRSWPSCSDGPCPSGCPGSPSPPRVPARC
jgi:hypothetical protein